eukprot:m.233539 g.233539  ORF g.233539 m.233539 type:complete len:1168 (+) comp40090_c0_seq2:37-3540(+)
MQNNVESKRYVAEFPFDERSGKELSFRKGDFVIVKRKTNGRWPDEKKWMDATNERTKQSGQVPGPYFKFYQDILRPSTEPPQSIASPSEPPKPKPRPQASFRTAPPIAPRRKKPESPLGEAPPPTRRSTEMPLPKRGQGQGLDGLTTPPPVPTRSASFQVGRRNAPPPVVPRSSLPPTSRPANIPKDLGHDLFDAHFPKPTWCNYCDEFIWGHGKTGLKCANCTFACHLNCKEEAMAAHPCNPAEAEDMSDEEDEDYTDVLDSHLSWTSSDVQKWMVAINMDEYASLFQQNQVDGKVLDQLDNDGLEAMGIWDPLHRQMMIETINELCRGSTSMKPSEMAQQPISDLPDGYNRPQISGPKPSAKNKRLSAASLFSLGTKVTQDRHVNGHNFKIHSFSALTWCEKCRKFLWGLIRQGMQCRACGYNCHRHCMTTEVPYCTPKRKGRPKAVVFGSELDEVMKDSNEESPLVVRKCIEAVEKKGLSVEGIYRLSASQSDVFRLKQLFDDVCADSSHVIINVDGPQWNDINSASGCLKLFFRELPTPLFTYNLYDAFLSAVTVSVSDAQKYSRIMEVVSRLPEKNRSVLNVLMKHLNLVYTNKSVNKMSAHNLAVVFGPTLVRPKPEDVMKSVTNSSSHISLIEILLVHGKWGNSAEEEDETDALYEPPADIIARHKALRAQKKESAGSGRVPPPRPPKTRAGKSDDGSSSFDLQDAPWFWGNISREEVTEKFRDMPDGSFLVRASTNTSGQYTVTVRKGGMNKLIRILHEKNLYGFSLPLTFHSVIELIMYYRHHSMASYNPSLNLCLSHPVSKFPTEQSVGGDGLDVDLMVRQLWIATDTFDQKNAEYLVEADRLERMELEMQIYKKKQLAQKEVYLILTEQQKVQEQMKSHVTDLDKQRLFDNMSSVQQRMAASRDTGRKIKMSIEDFERKSDEIIRRREEIKSQILNLQEEKEKYSIALSQVLSREEISRRLYELKRQDRGMESLYQSPKEMRARYDSPRLAGSIATFEMYQDMIYMSAEEVQAQWESRPEDPPESVDRIPRPRPIQKPRPAPPAPLPKLDKSMWFAENMPRGDATKALADKKDGTYLIRSRKPAPGDNHVYTVDIKWSGMEHIKVFQAADGRLGFHKVNGEFDNLDDLVKHYQKESLNKHNPRLTTTLQFPFNSPQ